MGDDSLQQLKNSQSGLNTCLLARDFYVLTLPEDYDKEI